MSATKFSCGSKIIRRTIFVTYQYFFVNFVRRLKLCPEEKFCPKNKIWTTIKQMHRKILPSEYKCYYFSFEMHALLNGHSNSWIDQNTSIKNEGMKKLIERQ